MSQPSSSECDSWLVPFDDMLADLGMYIPDMDDALGLFALRQAAHEFLSRTHHAQIEFLLPLQEGVDVYELPIPDGFRYQMLLTAKDHCGHLVPTKVDMDGWLKILRCVGGDFMELYCRVGLRPVRDITGIPTATMEEWGEVITYGAASRMLLMKDQDWEDQNLGKDFETKFKKGMNRARVRKYRGTQPGAIAMRSERWV